MPWWQFSHVQKTSSIFNNFRQTCRKQYFRCCNMVKEPVHCLISAMIKELWSSPFSSENCRMKVSWENNIHTHFCCGNVHTLLLQKFVLLLFLTLHAELWFTFRKAFNYWVQRKKKTQKLTSLKALIVFTALLKENNLHSLCPGEINHFFCPQTPFLKYCFCSSKQTKEPRIKKNLHKHYHAVIHEKKTTLNSFID